MKIFKPGKKFKDGMITPIKINPIPNRSRSSFSIFVNFLIISENLSDYIKIYLLVKSFLRH